MHETGRRPIYDHFLGSDAQPQPQLESFGQWPERELTFAPAPWHGTQPKPIEKNKNGYCTRQIDGDLQPFGNVPKRRTAYFVRGTGEFRHQLNSVVEFLWTKWTPSSARE